MVGPHSPREPQTAKFQREDLAPLYIRKSASAARQTNLDSEGQTSSLRMIPTLTTVPAEIYYLTLSPKCSIMTYFLTFYLVYILIPYLAFYLAWGLAKAATSNVQPFLSTQGILLGK